MLDFESPYFDMYMAELPKPKHKPNILHQETCPQCGRKLVNLYYSSQLDKYICKKCMDNLPKEKGVKEVR